MRLTRTPIAGLLVVVGVVAVPCAILTSVLRGRPLLGLDYGLDMGTFPMATALGILLGRMALDPGSRRRSVAGFVAAGAAAVLGYIACCRAVPEVVAWPVIYYINEVEPGFLGADTVGSYSLSLIVRGVILSSPQWPVALAGGLLARGWTTSSSP